MLSCSELCSSALVVAFCLDRDDCFVAESLVSRWIVHWRPLLGEARSIDVGVCLIVSRWQRIIKTRIRSLQLSLIVSDEFLGTFGSIRLWTLGWSYSKTLTSLLVNLLLCLCRWLATMSLFKTILWVDLSALSVASISCRTRSSRALVTCLNTTLWLRLPPILLHLLQQLHCFRLDQVLFLFLRCQQHFLALVIPGLLDIIGDELLLKRNLLHHMRWLISCWNILACQMPRLNRMVSLRSGPLTWVLLFNLESYDAIVDLVPRGLLAGILILRWHGLLDVLWEVSSVWWKLSGRAHIHIALLFAICWALEGLKWSDWVSVITRLRDSRECVLRFSKFWAV